MPVASTKIKYLNQDATIFTGGWVILCGGWGFVVLFALLQRARAAA